MSLPIIGEVYTSRIGDSNQLKEAITEATEFTHYRQTRDIKINRAEKILCEAMEKSGMLVLNGRSKPDAEGGRQKNAVQLIRYGWI